MKASALAFFVLAASALTAEQQPFERYQPIIDRQMFGQPPPNFDPTKPSSEAPKGSARGAEELTREQAVIKSSIHFSAINVTPDGATAVGFTDNSNAKMPVHYYLKVGEERNGWKVIEADPVKASMTIVKDDVEVSLELGANSGNGKGGGAASGAAATREMAGRGMGAGQRAGLLASRRGGFGGPSARNADNGGEVSSDASKFGSLRERRAAREQERAAEEAKERAKREAEREEQRKELQLLKDELKAQRDAAEKEREEREAERAAREQERAARMNQQQVDGNAED